VLRTPLRRSAWLSDAVGADVYLKLETLQPTYSFKIRGALNAVLAMQERRALVPMVTASAGNHGRALAYAAKAAGIDLTVYVPEAAPRTKVEAIRALGVRLHEEGDYDTAERLAKQHARNTRATYISPYSDRDVIAGAATIGLELLDDLPAIDTVVVPVGGGGLISGIALALHNRGVEMVGVEAEASCPFTRSLATGRVVPVIVAPTLADGLAGNLDPETVTFGIVKRLVDRIHVVDEDDIRAAIREVFAEERLVVEGAGAVGVAAMLKNSAVSAYEARRQCVVVILSGANIDPAKLRDII
jgi:threonine dehydratase